MMRQLSEYVDRKQRTELQIGLFVDFDDIVDNIAEEVARDRSLAAVLELSKALESTLCEGRGGSFLLRRVFGDFEALPASENGVQFELAVHGIDPRFIPNVNQVSMSDTALCVDVMDTITACSHINMFVIATGSRGYLPLLDHLRRQGKIVVLVAFSDLNLPDTIRQESDFMLLDGLRILQTGYQPTDGAPAAQSAPTTSFYPVRELEEGLCRDALLVIDEFFGQYEEIYLTPLLRRLSEELVMTEAYDPKAVISDLELAGAVRLEKRRGEPYDYTVMILNDEHPDVISVRTESENHTRSYTYPSYDGQPENTGTGPWEGDGYRRKIAEGPSSDV